MLSRTLNCHSIRLTATQPSPPTSGRRSSGSVHAWSPPPACFCKRHFASRSQPFRKPRSTGPRLRKAQPSTPIFIFCFHSLQYSASLIFFLLLSLSFRFATVCINHPGLAPSRRWAVKLSPSTHPPRFQPNLSQCCYSQKLPP